MNSQALIDLVATRVNLPRSTVRVAMVTLVAVIREALGQGEDVHLTGLGTFDSRWERERTVRSIRDGQKLVVDGRWHPAFRASSSLRAHVRARTPQVLKDAAQQRAWRLAEALVGDLQLYHWRDAPAGLTPDTDPVDVDAQCARALGPAWVRARQTWSEQTPAEVQASRDHLALAARRRWVTDRS